MKKAKIGISDIALYVPSPKITLDTIFDTRVKQDPDFERRLRRAIDVTGQKAIRFPDIFEDNATIAANSAKRLLDQNTELNLEKLRYLTVGTETAIDMSKPISAYVEGMLQRAGYELPTKISSFQVQHACAGGTLAMLSVAPCFRPAPGRTKAVW
jgi:hydroxymethylglutaryl-CoA synthase